MGLGNQKYTNAYRSLWRPEGVISPRTEIEDGSELSYRF